MKEALFERLMIVFGSAVGFLSIAILPAAVPFPVS